MIKLQTCSLVSVFHPFRIFGACMLLALLAGCAGLSQKIQDNDILLTAAVRSFTYEHVADKDGQIDIDKAQTILAHAYAIRGYATTLDQVTVTGLEAYLYQRVDWTTKTVVERQRAELYIAGLSALLNDKARKGELLPDTDGHVRIAVDYLIDTVIATLRVYQP